MAELQTIFEVNDRVIIMDGDLAGTPGKVISIGASGLLVVKPLGPDRHPPIVVPDSVVQLREIGPESA